MEKNNKVAVLLKRLKHLTNFQQNLSKKQLIMITRVLYDQLYAYKFDNVDEMKKLLERYICTSQRWNKKPGWFSTTKEM